MDDDARNYARRVGDANGENWFEIDLNRYFYAYKSTYTYRTMYRVALSNAHSRRQEAADVNFSIVETVRSGPAQMKNIQLMKFAGFRDEKKKYMFCTVASVDRLNVRAFLHCTRETRSQHAAHCQYNLCCQIITSAPLQYPISAFRSCIGMLRTEQNIWKALDTWNPEIVSNSLHNL